MNAGKTETDAIGKAKALADRIDAKYRNADAVEFRLGLTYEFLEDINELNDTVSGLTQGRESGPEINDLEKRLDAWNACVGQLYLHAHRNGVYVGQKDVARPA